MVGVCACCHALLFADCPQVCTHLLACTSLGLTCLRLFPAPAIPPQPPRSSATTWHTSPSLPRPSTHPCAHAASCHAPLCRMQAEEMAAARGMTLPEDFVAAAASGGLRRSVLDAYLRLASGGFITAWLVKSVPAFRNRLIRDRMFFFKVWAEVCIDSGEWGRGCWGGRTGPRQASGRGRGRRGRIPVILLLASRLQMGAACVLWV